MLSSSIKSVVLATAFLKFENDSSINMIQIIGVFPLISSSFLSGASRFVVYLTNLL